MATIPPAPEVATIADAEGNEAARGAFPIVAVGASAGGLAPTVELLRELGEKPGVAVVVIHHLDPLHESSLVDILSRSTPLPLEAAADGMLVELDHVYVMPPNAGLLISRGRLSLIPRVAAGGLHLPINRFFDSLALDQEALAVGVVLSGTGFDGTDGIKAIRRVGGITLAQDETAQYRSMPESAIATGCVDFVRPPAALAAELRRLGARVPALRATSGPDAEQRDYLQILRAMRRASGTDFTGYKHTTIRRRLERRLFFHGLSDLPTYLELLQRDPAEVDALCEEVLIHVTGFFRDREAFEALRTQVFPKLCEGRPRDAAIRIWIPGCSTGEEVYSIAMELLEFLDETRRDLPIKIFATDLSASIIETARAGRYAESIEGEVSSARLQRFFSKDERGYQIRRDVRDLCVFAKHDVARDPPFSSMDLISCRNLMIYLGPELQERVVALLHYALNEPGFLVLGSAESVRSFAGFTVVDGKNKIFARSSAAPRLTFDFTKPRLEPAGPAGSGSLDSTFGSRPPGQAEVFREADRLALAEFAPPGVVVTDDLAIVQFRGRTAPFLEHAPGAASLELLRTVREELRLPLRRALDQARASKTPAREAGISLFFDGEKRRTVTIEVLPFSVHAARLFLVLFADEATKPPAVKAAIGASDEEAGRVANAALQQELTSTRQYLESVIEQLEATNEELKAANEEIVSSNEELRSGNEELESAKEELQATNEELRTVNDEMRDRSVEASRLNDDLTNLLGSVEIPIMMLGRDSRLRRFTPAAGRAFGLVPADLGQLLSEVGQNSALGSTLMPLVSEVLDQLRPLDSTLRDQSGRWHQVWVRPYKTLDGRIDGTVIATRDIDTEKRHAEELRAAKKYAENVVESVRDGLVVLDGEERVSSANKAFFQAFRLEPKEVLGRRLVELGRRELATPALSRALQGLAAGRTVNNFQVEQPDAADGGRSFLLNAHRIDGVELCLLDFQDVTEIRFAREEKQRAEQAYQERLQRMSFEAAVTEERERRRIAIELHDRMGQALALAQIKLTSVRGDLAGEPRRGVDGAVELIEQAIVDARELIFELSPPILYDLGLKEALGWLAEDLEKRHGIKVEVSDDGADKPLDDAAKGVIFRAVRELLMNVLKHAQSGQAKVLLRRAGRYHLIDVEDRGIGFEPQPAKGAGGPQGFGLLSVREQISRLGGELTIESAPGRGTLASIRIPLQASESPSQPSADAGGS